MSLHIEVDGVPDSFRIPIEKAIRECVSPPDGEDWSVSVDGSGAFPAVSVKTLRQTRRRMFLLPISQLAEAIPDWLNLYPLQ